MQSSGWNRILRGASRLHRLFLIFLGSDEDPTEMYFFWRRYVHFFKNFQILSALVSSFIICFKLNWNGLYQFFGGKGGGCCLTERHFLYLRVSVLKRCLGRRSFYPLFLCFCLGRVAGDRFGEGGVFVFYRFQERVPGLRKGAFSGFLVRDGKGSYV